MSRELQPNFIQLRRLLFFSHLCFANAFFVKSTASKCMQSNNCIASHRRERLVCLFESRPDNSDNESPQNLLDLLMPHGSCNVDRMSGTDLAYIGDVVFELFVRSYYVWPSLKTSELQSRVVECVRAENQSTVLRLLEDGFSLSDKERQILARGRNATTRSKNRRNPAAYQDSTAFEALVGYLYIVDTKRCTDLLSWLQTNMDDHK